MYNVLKVTFALTINVGIHGHPLAHPMRGGGLPGCNPPSPKSKRNKKKYFVDTMISKVLCDLRFSLSRLPKSADD